MTTFETSTIPLDVTAATSLSAVSATGSGTAWDNGFMRSNHSMVVTTSGTVTSGAVALQVSLDGSNWVTAPGAGATVSPLSASAPVTLAVASNVCARYVRANVTTTIGGGGTITAVVSSCN